MKALWRDQLVGDILRLEYGKPLADTDRKPGGLYPVYGANGEKDRTDRFYFDRASIIVGRKGSAGEVNLTEDRFWPLDVTYFVTFDGREEDLRFLYYLLTTLDLPSLAKGVKPGLNRNEVYARVVRVPPLPEQQRIVAILDDAFAAIARARANTEQNLRNIREVFVTHADVVFSRHDEGWSESRLGDLVEFVSTGPFGSILHKSDYQPGGVPLINPINIEGDKIVPDDRKAVGSETARRLARYALRENDLVVGRRGDIGRCAVVTRDQSGWLCGTGCFFIRPSERTDPYFLAQLLRSRPYRARLEGMAARATMPSISNDDLADLVVRLPPVTQQRRISAALDDLAARIESLSAICDRKLTALDGLKQSILHQAFTGAL